GCASNEETIKSLRAGVSAANAECDKLESEVSKQKRAADAAKDDKEQFTSRIRELEADARSKTSNHEKQVKELTGKVLASSKQAKEQKERAEEQGKKVKTLTEQLSVKTEKGKEDDKCIKALKDELAQAKTTITTLQGQLHQASRPAGEDYARGYADGLKEESQRRRKWEEEACKKKGDRFMDPGTACMLQAGDFMSNMSLEYNQKINGLKDQITQLEEKLAKCRYAGDDGAGDSGSDEAGNIGPGVTLSTAEESGVAGTATVEPGTNAAGAHKHGAFQPSFPEPNPDDKNDANQIPHWQNLTARTLSRSTAMTRMQPPRLNMGHNLKA
ncbi:MAG: hypothetical protein Q9181_006127, partial [Wetmoreana brouardii]